MPDTSKGKRRRGSQRQRDTSGSRQKRWPAESTTGSGIAYLPWLVGAAIVAVIVIAGYVILRPGGGSSAATSPGASGSCPTSQPAALPTGDTRTVTLTTPKGAIVIKVQADLSPIAAGNFVALASCGFYDGTVVHRTASLQDGTPFVIQGGDPEGTGLGGPGYTIKDEPVTTPYKRGTVAMARSAQPDSVGSQFFIVLDDKDADVLTSANTYQIIGDVTSGMDTADAIFAASGGQEKPANPVPITAATVANP